MFFMCLCCHIMANKDIYIYIYITIYSAGWRWRTIGTGWRNKQACLCILFAFSSLERRSCYLFSHGLTDSFLGAAARPMKSLKGCFLLQHLMYGIGCRLITESSAFDRFLQRHLNAYYSAITCYSMEASQTPSSLGQLNVTLGRRSRHNLRVAES